MSTLENVPLWIKYGTKKLSFVDNNICQDYYSLRLYYFDMILKDNKKIPTIDLLKQNGEWYGARLENNSGIDGFGWSYFMMKYLISQNIDIVNLLDNPERINQIEKTLIPDTLSYFNNLLNTNNIKNNFEDLETPEELLDYMLKHFNYGYIDVNGEKHFDNLKGVRDNYKVLPSDVTKQTNIGMCIDQVKFEKDFFDKKGIENKIICIKYKENNEETKDKIHPILVYKENNSWCYFEHSFNNLRGIHKFEKLEDTYNFFIEKGFRNRCKIENIKEIDNIPVGLTIDELIKYVDNYQFEKNNIVQETNNLIDETVINHRR